jgi:hypothetical protein
MFTGYDAACPGLTAAIQREKGWEDKTGRYEWIPEGGLNRWGVPAVYLKRVSSKERLFTTFYAMSRGWPHCVWPRTTKDMIDDEEVEVPIEVRSDAVGSSGLRSACRCYHS